MFGIGVRYRTSSERDFGENWLSGIYSLFSDAN